mmetsp:Transcript_13554/g.38134  ORF Transcript_13554/g.38134 Transcript_13554/m.38134 type:complete len:500 (-) Transcript_13554:369-1868(-)
MRMRVIMVVCRIGAAGIVALGRMIVGMGMIVCRIGALRIGAALVVGMRMRVIVRRVDNRLAGASNLNSGGCLDKLTVVVNGPGNGHPISLGNSQNGFQGDPPVGRFQHSCGRTGIEGLDQLPQPSQLVHGRQRRRIIIIIIIIILQQVAFVQQNHVGGFGLSHQQIGDAVRLRHRLAVVSEDGPKELLGYVLHPLLEFCLLLRNTATPLDAKELGGLLDGRPFVGRKVRLEHLGVHHRHQRVQSRPVHERHAGLLGLLEGRPDVAGVRNAGHFHHNVLEGLEVFRVGIGVASAEIADRDQLGDAGQQLVAERAAGAAVLQLDESVAAGASLGILAVLHGLDELPVDVDVRHVVDDNADGTIARFVFEQMRQECRLSGSEESGNHRDGNDAVVVIVIGLVFVIVIGLVFVIVIVVFRNGCLRLGGGGRGAEPGFSAFVGVTLRHCGSTAAAAAHRARCRRGERWSHRRKGRNGGVVAHRQGHEGYQDDQVGRIHWWLLVA